MKAVSMLRRFLLVTLAGLSVALVVAPVFAKDWSIDISEHGAEYSEPVRISTATQVESGHIITAGFVLSVFSEQGDFGGHKIRLPGSYNTGLIPVGSDVLVWGRSSEIGSDVRCDLKRISIDGVLRWRERSNVAACVDVVLGDENEAIVLWRELQANDDGSGSQAAWLSNISSVGAENWRSDPVEALESPYLVRDAAGAQVYMVTRPTMLDKDDDELPTPIEVDIYDISGRKMLSWRSEQLYRRIVAAESKPAGGLLVAVEGDGDIWSRALTLLHFDANGEVVQFEVKHDDERRNIGSYAGNGNFTYVLDDFSGGGYQIRGVEGEGAVVWNRDVPRIYLQQQDVEVLRNGDLLIVAEGRIERIDSNGKTIILEEFDYLDADFLLESHDGQLFSYVTRMEQNGDYSNLSETILQMSAEGDIVSESALPPSKTFNEPGVDVHAGAEGTGVYLTNGDARLTAIDNTGTMRWRKQLTSANAGAIAECGDGWLCAADRFAGVLFEIEEATGEERWHWPVPVEKMILTRLMDGSIHMAGRTSSAPIWPGFEVLRLQAGGGVSDGKWLYWNHLLAVSDRGTTLHWGLPPQLMATDGSITEYPSSLDIEPALVTLGEFDEYTLPGLLDSNNVATIHIVDCDFDDACGHSIAVARFGMEGSRWLVSTGAPATMRSGLSSSTMLRDVSGDVYSVLAGWTSVGPGMYGWHQIYATKVSADGELLWRRKWTQSGTAAVDAFLSSADDALALVWGRVGSEDKTLVAIDAETGRIRSEQDIPCPGATCEYWDVDVGDDGTVIAAGMGAERSVLVGRYGMLADKPALRIDQAAFSGAWYAPRSDGQGFTLRYFPDSRTWFMPWFTYTAEGEGSNEPGELRWYALQGTVEPGATEATLAIIERVGGIFDQQPADSYEIVGEARLRFFTCDRGLLEFEFDGGSNEGKAGTIRLHSLLPRGDSCTDIDGSIIPAIAHYDTDLTGSWYDPGADGQGVELFRLASTASDAGLLYAAWFTFDPENGENAATDQHWFTLQGQQLLDEGVVRTTIVQTLGGSFDQHLTRNTFRVGEVDLVPQACDRLLLRYRFDTNAGIAGEFRGRSGEIALRRLGTCAGD